MIPSYPNSYFSSRKRECPPPSETIPPSHPSNGTEPHRCHFFLADSPIEYPSLSMISYKQILAQPLFASFDYQPPHSPLARCYLAFFSRCSSLVCDLFATYMSGYLLGMGAFVFSIPPRSAISNSVPYHFLRSLKFSFRQRVSAKLSSLVKILLFFFPPRIHRHQRKVLSRILFRDESFLLFPRSEL